MENEFVPYDIALAMEELGWGKENTMYYAYSRATKNLYPHRFEFPYTNKRLDSLGRSVVFGQKQGLLMSLGQNIVLVMLVI
jgi:hypothetical protein